MDIRKAQLQSSMLKKDNSFLLFFLFTYLICKNFSYNHVHIITQLCVVGLFSPKDKVSSKLWVILNARSILSLVFPTTKYAPRGHNRDLRFDLGRYWIKVAHLKEPFCQIYWIFSQKKEKRKRKQNEKENRKNQYA